MKKITLYISALILSLTLLACGGGFNQSKAEELLQKSTLSSEEYSELIQLYSQAVDDAIEMSKKQAEELSEKEREEVITLFAIGMRLSKEEASLSDAQKKEVEEINKKGTEQLHQ